MGRLCLISQPFVIAFSMWFRILDYGQTILDADRVAQALDGFCAAPEVSEFPVTVQIDGTPNDVVE